MERNDMSRLIRTFTARYLLAGVIVGALAVAGCSAAGPNTHGGKQAKVALKFQMTSTTSSSGKPETLTCDPAGGNQAGAASACSTLLKLKKNPFAPLAKGVNCPMLLRSNRRILVTGTWFGVTVHRVVVDGGCDTALFDSLHKIIH
jgi:Subtilisin inhibitor-like